MELAPEDYIAIQQLYARYAFAVDTGDQEGWLACWIEDGALETSTGQVNQGPEALRALVEAQVSNPNEKGYHWNGNLVIEPPDRPRYGISRRSASGRRLGRGSGRASERAACWLKAL